MPAESATLHVVDAVLTRMGASDNLALGRSTFLEASTVQVCNPLRRQTGVRFLAEASGPLGAIRQT